MQSVEELITELRGLAEKATPGRWTVQRLNHAQGDTWLQIGWIENDEREIGPLAELIGGAVKCRVPLWHPVAVMQYLVASDEELLANAEYIAAANPQAVARLCDELQAARRERDVFRAVLDGMRFCDLDGLASMTVEEAEAVGQLARLRILTMTRPAAPSPQDSQEVK